MLDLFQAEQTRARELEVSQHEVENSRAADAGSLAQAVHLIAGQRFQQVEPLDRFERLEPRRICGERLRGTYVNDPASHVGTLQIAAEHQQRECIIAAHGPVKLTGQRLHTAYDALEE